MIDFSQLEIVVVHYLQAKPTVAMLNAFFRLYPELRVSVVDNSGGDCPAADQVLPHLPSFQNNINIWVNPATVHGSRGPLSHGAGLDLAFSLTDKPYLLSLESDLFVLEKGPVEYLLSLMSQGYDWAGQGQKPVQGGFASFSPSFAIFRVELIKKHGLSFKVMPTYQVEVDQDHPLLMHHRQTAARIRSGLPVFYLEGKAPDTYRRVRDELQQTEYGHLGYFDTGEWVHHELTSLGYKGYLFVQPPGAYHSWGSRDDRIFLANLQERMPDGFDVNCYLPKALRVARHDGPLPSACLALLGPDERSADHWAVIGGGAGVEISTQGQGLCLNCDFDPEEKLYVGMGKDDFATPPPEVWDARIFPNVLYRLQFDVSLIDAASVTVWLIEYSSSERLCHHTKNQTSGTGVIEFFTNPDTERFRVFFRVSGKGQVLIQRLTMSAPYHPDPVPYSPPPRRYQKKRNGCILLSADALRADFFSLLEQFDVQDEVPTLSEFAKSAQSPREAHSTAPWTMPAHMSMFTGLFPHQHGYGVDFKLGRSYPLPRHLPYLPEFLVEKGIASYGFHNGGVLEAERGFGHGWTRYTGSHPGDVDAPIHNFIKALPNLEETFFAFIHTYTVHNYYGESGTPFSMDLLTPLQRGYLRGLQERWGNLRWMMADNLREEVLADARTLDLVRRLYVGAVLRFERIFKQLIDALRTSGIYDDCTVILTSDHGEALGEIHHGTQHWSHMTTNVHPETIMVPFYVKPAEYVLPKIPDFLSLAQLPELITSYFGVRSVFPAHSGDFFFASGASNQFGTEWEKSIPHEGRVYRSVLFDRQRRFYFSGDSFTPEYVLDSSGGEMARAFSSEELALCRGALDRYSARIPFPGDGPLVLDEDMAKMMRDLGYVE